MSSASWGTPSKSKNEKREGVTERKNSFSEKCRHRDDQSKKNPPSRIKTKTWNIVKTKRKLSHPIDKKSIRALQNIGIKPRQLSTS